MAADASALCRMMYCVNKKARYHINPYIGHDSQCYGIEEHRLVGGKGDGMRLLEIRNGKGLEMTVSPDRGGGYLQTPLPGRQSVLFFTLRVCGAGLL